MAKIDRSAPTGFRGRSVVIALAGLLALTSAATAEPAGAAKPSVREITESLYKADPAAPLDFSGDDLKLIDLSGIDFKRARMAHADLFGADLTGADLSGVDLAGARLDRAVLMRANFSGAHLFGATILRPTIFSGLAFNLEEAPRFTGADLRGVRITARLDGTDFADADMRGIDLSPHEMRGDITLMPRNVCFKCNFAGADLRGADLKYVLLTFANFARANLQGANLSHCDLSRADLSGADLTGADLTAADLDGASLSGVRGLDTVRGLAMAHNLDRALR